jgi:hypothetical protein
MLDISVTLAVLNNGTVFKEGQNWNILFISVTLKVLNNGTDSKE